MLGFLVFVHVGVCLFLILMVMIQGGKGADMGASFGGSSQTVFGSGGGVTFFTKLTGALVAAFFLSSILLAVISSHYKAQSVIPTNPEGIEKQEQPAKPPAAEQPVEQPIPGSQK